MFTTFRIFRSEPFSRRERCWLLAMLQDYSRTFNGCWIQELDYRNLNFKWCPAMSRSDGVMGCFCPISPRTIYLMPQSADIVPTGERVVWIELLFVTIIHELWHMRQWRRNPLKYIVCALPILRQYTLEREAIAAQDAAGAYVARWTAEYDHRDAVRMGLASDVKVGKVATDDPSPGV